MNRDRVGDRQEVREERTYHDRQVRPGREGQASVGHRFLSRPALTKTRALYGTSYTYAGGVVSQTSMGLFGVSTWGEATFKEAL